MNIAAIIPSRYLSSRFEGKPLAIIAGVTMIERVYRQVQKSGKFTHIIVATDDQRIADTVKSFGGTPVFTSSEHQSGSERIWEVMEKNDFDAAINIQGDEPIVSEKLIADLYDQLHTKNHDVVTAAYFNRSYQDYISPHVVKVVMNSHSQSLYFSRAPIPFVTQNNFTGFYQHVGMYGYLRSALKRFIQLPPGKLEKTEKLEQLRFLENNIDINVIFSQEKSIGVDVPEDIARVEEILKTKTT